MAQVLIVEDNELNRDMLSRRLRKRGYDVLLAVDGTAGVSAAIDEVPDLILMDLTLPGISGHEATRQIRQQETTRHIPVIALTAHAMERDRQRALESGCDEFETKPIDLPRLLGKMVALLP
jgi:CheY-like chemotaxis protein